MEMFTSLSVTDFEKFLDKNAGRVSRNGFSKYCEEKHLKFDAKTIEKQRSVFWYSV